MRKDFRLSFRELFFYPVLGTAPSGAKDYKAGQRPECAQKRLPVLIPGAFFYSVRLSAPSGAKDFKAGQRPARLLRPYGA